MEQRILGRTGVKLSVLGFGCGAVGGLMVRGSAADQERAVARAVEFGINYFDTAAAYGNGESEKNLGRVLKALRPEIAVGTKFTILPGDRGKIGAAVAASLEASLKRARRRNDRVAAQSGRDEGRFEAEEDGFHRRVWEKYREIADREPDRVVLIEGDLGIDEVHEQIVEAVAMRFSETHVL